MKSVTSDAVRLIYEQIPDTPVTIKLAFGEQPAPAAAASTLRGGKGRSTCCPALSVTGLSAFGRVPAFAGMTTREIP